METELPLTAPTQQPLMLNCPAGVRVRPMFDGERSTFRWNYYSVKNWSHVACASPDGLRALYHAEVCTDVVGYRTQVEPARLKVGRRSVTFEPHLEETLFDGRIIISTFADLLEDHDSGKPEIVEHALAYYAALGIDFRVRGHPEIGHESTADAVEAIQTFRRTRFTDEDIWLVKEAISKQHAVPLAEVRDTFKSPALGFAKLSAMMVHRIIAIDLTHELSPSSPIRLLNSC